jgi:hypothetical protein
MPFSVYLQHWYARFQKPTSLNSADGVILWQSASASGDEIGISVGDYCISQPIRRPDIV